MNKFYAAPPQRATFKNTIILFAYPPRCCISIVFIFSWAHCKSQEKLETMLMQNFEGQTKSIMVFLKVAFTAHNSPLPPILIQLPSVCGTGALTGNIAGDVLKLSSANPLPQSLLGLLSPSLQFRSPRPTGSIDCSQSPIFPFDRRGSSTNCCRLRF